MIVLIGISFQRNAGLHLQIVRGEVHEHADAPHPLAATRPRRRAA
jgi:hypothetical protein